MKKSFGFTLAEVLITLGIIGVVAAMTMPTLMNSTQGAQYKAAYKKALSAIAQGVTLNVALDGSSFADVSDAAGIKDILAARMNVVNGADEAGTIDYEAGEAELLGTQGEGNYTLYFSDGIVFSFSGPTNNKVCSDPDNDDSGISNGEKCKGFIDVNGLKGPNKVVTCSNAQTGADTEAADAQHTANCVVKNPTDIYPVVFYDQTILPNSQAAKAVLYGK